MDGFRIGAENNTVDSLQTNRSQRAGAFEKGIHDLSVYRVELEMQNQELESSKQRLNQSEDRYKRMFDYAPIAYVTLDHQGIILSKNIKAFELIREISHESTPFVVHVHPQHHADFFTHLEKTFHSSEPTFCEIRLRSSLGSYVTVRLTSILISERSEYCLTAILDMTEIRQKEEVISHMAYHDFLTDLPNRSSFLSHVVRAIRVDTQAERQFAVLFIDLDNFKNVNDTQGHDAGDFVLKEIASRISRIIGRTDTLARLGGDEFALMLDCIQSVGYAERIACNILEIITQPIYCKEIPHLLTASIGISYFPMNGDTADELLKNADTAMYRAKNAGKNRICSFDPSMNVETLSKIHKEQKLRQALKKHELYIHYQPQINVHTGKIRGIEALLRWRSADFGEIPPDEFIVLAEETLFIKTIGKWVLYHACRRMAKWCSLSRSSDIKISVNVSIIQLMDDSFVEAVKLILNRTSLRPDLLELEITESINIMGQMKVIDRLNQIKQLGVGISLDDFGTGYSSLNYLRSIPIDVLKIDKSYINNIAGSRSEKMLAESIIYLSHKLGYQVVAEGVETKEQTYILKKLNCDIIQGYHYFRPMPEGDMEKIILLQN